MSATFFGLLLLRIKIKEEKIKQSSQYLLQIIYGHSRKPRVGGYSVDC